MSTYFWASNIIMLAIIVGVMSRKWQCKFRVIVFWWCLVGGGVGEWQIDRQL